MDLNIVTPHFGQSVLTPSLIDDMERFGVDLRRELTLPSGQFSAHIERPKDGFSLTFTDEAMFLGSQNQAIGVGPLCFSGIFLYSEGREGYSQYQEPIPFGITFSMNRSDLWSSLGPSNWNRTLKDGSTVADRWDEKASYRIHVTYKKGGAEVAIVSLFVPNSALK